MKDIIIIPTYNEKENITQLIPIIFKLVPQIFILVIDDNSPDGTAIAVKNFQKKFPNLTLLLRPKKEGLGKAYTQAFREVLGQDDVRAIITMDADFSHNPSYIPQMLKLIGEYDVIIGSRYVKGGKIEGWELWRKILSRFGNFYFKFFTNLPIFDCTSGFDTYRTDILKKINFDKINSSGYAFLMELKYYLWKTGAHFKEIPIIFMNRRGGESKLSSHIISEGILAPWKIIFRNRV